MQNLQTIVNLTPHDIKVVIDGNTITFNKSDRPIPRVSMNRTLMATLMGIPLYKNVTGEVENVPPTGLDELYIVSAMVRLALPNRLDLVSPGNLIRDTAGNVIGCDGFDWNSL